jgi:hypothetical protein
MLHTKLKPASGDLGAMGVDKAAKRHLVRAKLNRGLLLLLIPVFIVSLGVALGVVAFAGVNSDTSADQTFGGKYGLQRAVQKLLGKH